MFRQTLAIAALAASVSMAAGDLAVESQLKGLDRFLNEEAAETQGYDGEQTGEDHGET